MLNPTFAGIQALRKDLVKEIDMFPLIFTTYSKDVAPIVVTENDEVLLKSPINLSSLLSHDIQRDDNQSTKLLNSEYSNILLTDSKKINWILFTQFIELGKFTSCGIIHSDTPAMSYYVEERLDFINKNVIKKTWWNQYGPKYVEALISVFSPRLSFVLKVDKLLRH
jgi:hypothetical protein